MSSEFVLGGLGAVILLVLVLPFTIRKIEEEIEVFLLVMGTAAVTISGSWSLHLVWNAVHEPVKISLAVLIFGFLFRRMRHHIHYHVAEWARRLGAGLFIFTLIVGLGILSSVITAIMAALVLVEIISGMKMERGREDVIVVLACFSIGLGAALTPLGEPLSTIAISKLSGEPYHADFFFLARLLWPWIVPGIIALGILAAVWAGPHMKIEASTSEEFHEPTKNIIWRAVKVYGFVAALVLLGEGFLPVVETYLLGMSKGTLYWVNSISAILDNATLAAAEISPKMSLARIEFLLMGLLIAGGMLIPGNIPNIISAGKLDIKSGEWAKIGVPVGAILMVIYFVLMEILVKVE